MGASTGLLDRILKLILVVQAVCGVSVLLRLIRSSGGTPLSSDSGAPTAAPHVAVLVPVRNEATNIEECLESVHAMSHACSIVVIDGGSDDGTEGVARRWSADKSNVQVLQAGSSPPNWNGKVWGLAHGLASVPAEAEWILTIDADVIVDEDLVDALAARADAEQLDLVSVATEQKVKGHLLSMLHPSMLTTLVYRFGIPGHVATSFQEVQANGQCFLSRRDALETCGGFEGVKFSICEDVTLARLFVEQGYRVGFYEGGSLVSTEMYTSFRSAWYGWSRSLPTRDRYFGRWGWTRLVEVLFAQGLAFPTTAALLLRPGLLRTPWQIIPVSVLMMRIGTLFGIRRAYRNCDRTYWLSPLLDLPVAVRLFVSALKTHYVWRGQELVRGE